jgi:hypothetical protein
MRIRTRIRKTFQTQVERRSRHCPALRRCWRRSTWRTGWSGSHCTTTARPLERGGRRPAQAGRRGRRVVERDRCSWEGHPGHRADCARERAWAKATSATRSPGRLREALVNLRYAASDGAWPHGYQRGNREKTSHLHPSRRPVIIAGLAAGSQARQCWSGADPQAGLREPLSAAARWARAAAAAHLRRDPQAGSASLANHCEPAGSQSRHASQAARRA